MEEKFCRMCEHFRQHYVKLDKNKYSAIYYGHCVYPRLKRRESAAHACEHFKEYKGK